MAAVRRRVDRLMRQGPVLITGAGGFIGGRMAEVFTQQGVPVRAAVRRWASAARVGRLDIDLVACDIRRRDDLQRVMDGCSAVIHCAVGDRSVTVDGTEQVLATAHALGVAQVVHVSTIDVYGDANGPISEATPRQTTGRPYGDTKIEAEARCEAWRAQGLPVTILRPSIVYGPFSDGWTVHYAQRFQAGAWPLPASAAQGTCNLLYVDDLVSACRAALVSGAAANDTFNVNGADRPTWHAYFEALNAALGLPPLAQAAPTVARVKAAAMAPVKRAAKYLLANHQAAIMAVYQRSEFAKRLMRRAESTMKHAPNPAEFRLYGKVLDIDTHHITAQLGWRPTVRMADGIALSAAWLRHAGYAPPRGD